VKPPDPGSDPGGWSKASLALAIPTLLAAGPLVGLGLAWAIRRLTGFENRWLTLLCIALGAAAGVREVARVIRRIS
jgi:hypothetical protein